MKFELRQKWLVKSSTQFAADTYSQALKEALSINEASRVKHFRDDAILVEFGIVCLDNGVTVAKVLNDTFD